ncbi:hypothetical protein [Tropicibacter oceani]|uniref:Oxidoreductase n=1 Tax=Tropicibacter oceani TaxID=3058420 RepID=A0ABY8QKK9_9RHOB|nr:hypothetical protein [Tropicibacter oceani]WGW05152.1 hypothetical protein QF118_06305 [Tropicibacter oceani]
MSVNHHRKSLPQMESDRPWTSAEQRLLDGARNGLVIISDSRPDAPSDAVDIRADLVRHLLLGGCDACPVNHTGPYVRGAWISGTLDLQMIRSDLALQLECCSIENTPLLWDASLYGLSLEDCRIPGLQAHRLKTTGPVYLCGQDFVSTGTVNLNSARIGDSLACDGGTFDGNGQAALTATGAIIRGGLILSNGFSAKGTVALNGANVTMQVTCAGASFDGDGQTALNADGITIGADLFLNNGFSAKGTVTLIRASVIGQIACVAGTFDGNGRAALNADAMTIGSDFFLNNGFSAKGTVTLIQASVAGQVACVGGSFDGDLIAEAMTVKAGLLWRDVAKISGALNLAGAHVGVLVDDWPSWAKTDKMHLNGFRYDRLTSLMTVQQRLDWLGKKQDATIEPPFGAPFDFHGRTYKLPTPFIHGSYQPKCDPQPYTQLARVLREQGAAQGAARVLEERDRRVFRASYHRALAGVDGTLRAGWAAQVAIFRRPFDWLFGAVFGYGHRPARALLWVALIIGLNWALYAQAYDHGQMAPTSDVVLTSGDWTGAVAAYDNGAGPLPQLAWPGSATEQDYTTFHPFLYAVDLFVPLEALGQETTWAPSPLRGIWGKIGYWTGWIVQLSGWIITAIAAAVMAGLVGRKE